MAHHDEPDFLLVGAQGLVNAGVAFFVYALNAVTHGLHKAVDQRGLDVGARRAHDAAGTDGARVQVGEELLFPLGAQLGFFDAGQGARHGDVVADLWERLVEGSIAYEFGEWDKIRT